MNIQCHPGLTSLSVRVNAAVQEGLLYLVAYSRSKVTIYRLGRTSTKCGMVPMGQLGSCVVSQPMTVATGKGLG